MRLLSYNHHEMLDGASHVLRSRDSREYRDTTVNINDHGGFDRDARTAQPHHSADTGGVTDMRCRNVMMEKGHLWQLM